MVEKIFTQLEVLARTLQLWYMRKRKTTEVATSVLIKFHPQDARERVLKEYKKRLKKLGLALSHATKKQGVSSFFG